MWITRKKRGFSQLVPAQEKRLYKLVLKIGKKKRKKEAFAETRKLWINPLIYCGQNVNK